MRLLTSLGVASAAVPAFTPGVCVVSPRGLARFPRCRSTPAPAERQTNHLAFHECVPVLALGVEVFHQSVVLRHFPLIGELELVAQNLIKVLACFDSIVDRSPSAGLLSSSSGSRAASTALVDASGIKILSPTRSTSRFFELRIQTANHHDVTLKFLPGQSLFFDQNAPQGVAVADLAIFTFDFLALKLSSID